jgi:hypothetical protein
MVIGHYLRTGEQHPSFVTNLLLASSLALIIFCERESPPQQDNAARVHAATRYCYQTEITRANVSGKVLDEQIWSVEMYIGSLGGADPLVPGGGSSGVSPTRTAQR